jgi:replicative DNA helicase
MVPFDANAEKGLLGCCILGDYNNAVADGVTDDWFNELTNKAAWHLLGRVGEKGDVTEQLVIAAANGDQAYLGNGGSLVDLVSMVDTAPSAGNYGYWMKPCREKLRLRRYYQLGLDMQQAVAEAEDVDVFADDAESRMFELRKFKEQDKGNARLESFSRIIDLLQAAHEGTGVIGLPTGYEDLDKILCGLRSGALYTLAARPGMGKSTLAMNIAETLSVKGQVPVAFFSLEMSADELNQRMLGSYSSINLQRFINHDYDKEERVRLLKEMAKKIPTLNAAPIHICPRTDITISQLRAEARRYVKNYGAKLVIVDYLQLVAGSKGSRGNRVAEVGEISRGLKKMALELDVPVIALAQLNRAIEQDGNRVPRLSDLRESGSIEADSDCVMFIHCENTSVYIDGRLLCQIVVSKNRSGRQGKFDIAFNRDFSRFEDWRTNQDLVDMAESMAKKKTTKKSFGRKSA